MRDLLIRDRDWLNLIGHLVVISVGLYYVFNLTIGQSVLAGWWAASLMNTVQDVERKVVQTKLEG